MILLAFEVGVAYLVRRPQPWLLYATRLALLLAYALLARIDLARGLALTDRGSAGLVVVAATLIVLGARQRAAWRRAFASHPTTVARWLLYLLIAVAFVEELTFRGALLLAVGGGALALVASAAAHTAWHLPYYVRTFSSQTPMLLAVSFVTALVLGIVTLWSESLWPAILAHAGADALGQVSHLSAEQSKNQRL